MSFGKKSQVVELQRVPRYRIIGFFPRRKRRCFPVLSVSIMPMRCVGFVLLLTLILRAFFCSGLMFLANVLLCTTKNMDWMELGGVEWRLLCAS